MNIIAIDPGTEQSAYVTFDGAVPVEHATLPNIEVRELLKSWSVEWPLVIENVESYGKPVGRETFETVRWLGRFEEIWCPRHVVFVSRRHVKLWLCNSSSKVSDANIHAAIYDIFGGSRQKAVGTKSDPGPLYGLKGHEFAALAVAVTFTQSDAYRQERSVLRETIEAEAND